MAWAGPVDINTADAKTRSAAELARGRRHDGGGDRRLSDGERAVRRRPTTCARVKGIGDKILEQNRANIRVTAEKGAAEK